MKKVYSKPVFHELSEAEAILRIGDGVPHQIKSNGAG
jgi:hypothetical protein